MRAGTRMERESCLPADPEVSQILILKGECKSLPLYAVTLPWSSIIAPLIIFCGT